MKFAEKGRDGLPAFPEGYVVAVALLVGLHGEEGVVGQGAGEVDVGLDEPVVLVWKESGVVEEETEGVSAEQFFVQEGCR